MIVATHDGNFHTDEIFAIAILKLIYPKIKIVRTRNKKALNKAEIKVDIGRKYCPKKGYFDHHQEDFKEKRNNIPYASAGLIWRNFGNKLAKNKDSFNYIDEILIQPIDAHDSGVEIYNTKTIQPYTIDSIISSFRLSWKKKKLNQNKEFKRAVFFATELLKREIDLANDTVDTIKAIKKAISKSNKEYLVLEYSRMPWKKIVSEYPNIKLVVHPDSKNWAVEGVPIVYGNFKIKKELPRDWADLEGKELAKKTGVKDAIFCHKNLFFAIAKSKEGAIRLTELALKE